MTDKSAETRGFEAFGLDIRYGQTESEAQNDGESAAQTVESLLSDQEFQAATDILEAAENISKVVVIERTTPQATQGIMDIFTARQITQMHDRMTRYLGTNIDTHMENLRPPRGYPAYVGRLALHFASDDDSVTHKFAAFEETHTNPSPNATGPTEHNSRQYAELANDQMLRQLTDFYRADFSVRLVGPQKRGDAGQNVWEAGIAECQFMVLDYIRDELAHHGTKGNLAPHAAMTIDDIDTNITTILANRQDLERRTRALNPMLGIKVTDMIDNLKAFTHPTLHRGRWGAPLFHKQPRQAQATILRLEALLLHAGSLEAVQATHADIPVFDISKLVNPEA